MNALNWIRTNATEVNSETFKLEDGRTVKSTLRSFKGVIPNRMVFEVKKELFALVSGEYENETLRLGGERRSDFGKCEYFHTTYKIV